MNPTGTFTPDYIRKSVLNKTTKRKPKKADYLTKYEIPYGKLQGDDTDDWVELDNLVRAVAAIPRLDRAIGFVAGYEGWLQVELAIQLEELGWTKVAREVPGIREVKGPIGFRPIFSTPEAIMKMEKAAGNITKELKEIEKIESKTMKDEDEPATRIGKTAADIIAKGLTKKNWVIELKCEGLKTEQDSFISNVTRGYYNLNYATRYSGNQWNGDEDFELVLLVLTFKKNQNVLLEEPDACYNHPEFDIPTKPSSLLKVKAFWLGSLSGGTVRPRASFNLKYDHESDTFAPSAMVPERTAPVLPGK